MKAPLDSFHSGHILRFDPNTRTLETSDTTYMTNITKKQVSAAQKPFICVVILKDFIHTLIGQSHLARHNNSILLSINGAVATIFVKRGGGHSREKVRAL